MPGGVGAAASGSGGARGDGDASTSTPGSGGMTASDDGSTSSGGADNTASAGQSGAEADGAGGTRAGSDGATAGGHTGDAGSSAGGDASDDGAGGTGAQDGGAVEPVPVNRCTVFVDRTGEAAARTVAWGFPIATSPDRCMRIAVGQTVTFEGMLGSHPLGGLGGDTPNPILADYGPNDTEYSVTFPAVGTFGFECGNHSSMRGAIDVVDLGL